MRPSPCSVLCCSRCRHYQLEGRRGGHCSQLGVPVQGRWQACSLSVPVFMPTVPEMSPLEILPPPIEVYFPEPLVPPMEVPDYAEPSKLLQVPSLAVA